jgi:peptidyl-prolyl cis-trans isomerase D
MFMLQSIRDRTHGWIAGVIISLVILSFGLWGIHSYLESSGNNDSVAKVNGIEITKRQLAAAFDPLRNQVQMNMGSAALPENLENELKHRALAALINIQVLKQASISHHYQVSDEQIGAYLESMPDFQINGQFSNLKFRQLLARNMLSMSDFVELIKTTLLIDQPRFGVLFSSFALPNEINETIALINQERELNYLIIPRDYFLSKNSVITDTDIKTYYQQHQNEFKTPEQVSIDYLELSTKEVAAGLHPSDDTLKNYYHDNIDSYTEPAQWNLETLFVPVTETATEKDITAAQKKIADLKNNISKGADFSALEKQNPYPGNKIQGWVTINSLPSDIQKAVSNLTMPGQVTEPIKVSQGLIIIKSLGNKAAVIQTFEQVQGKVKDAWVRQQTQEKFAEQKEKLASLTYENPDSLAAAAKALLLTPKTSQSFSHEKAGSDISANQKIRDIAFSPDVLNSQNNSDVIQVDSDTVIVLRIKSHAPASLIPLESVKKQIADKLQIEKTEKAAYQLANEIKQQLQSKKITPEQVAQQYHFTWSNPGFIGRYAKKVDSAILYTAFRLPRPEKNSTGIYTSVKIPSGYAIVNVSKLRDGTHTNQQQYDVFAEQVQSSDGLLEYKLYENSLTEKSKIKLLLDS